MPRIILSLALITITGGALVFGGTKAFFSDVETSTANVFTAGAIDLKIDNESYYNGVLNASTTWSVTDLTVHKFFDFDDVKPDDYGEDTISLHVDTNDAYLCANVTLTSNNDNGLTEPEGLVDETPGPVGDGELANLINFIWWADDGDNVLEDDENVISQGPIGALTLDEAYPIPLADSQTNIWTGVGGPVPGLATRYIGKAWCFGSIDPAPLEQDGLTTISPAGNNTSDEIAGTPEDGGISCDGVNLGNESQTDSLTADVTFTAVQARHNDTFLCERPVVRETKLTLVKNVVNDNLGNAPATAWTLLADGPTDLSGITGSTSVTNVTVLPGQYTLSEGVGPIGYTASSSFSCVVNGGVPTLGNNLTLNQGDVAVCTITNNDNTPLSCNVNNTERRYADTVVSSDIGVRKNNTQVTVDRDDPADALGAPQSLGTPFDSPVVFDSFFSLGFDEGTDDTPNEGGKIVLAFGDNYIVDGPGNDIRAWEVTGGTTYPTEKIKIEVSQDNVTWYTAASSLDRDAEADLNSTPLEWAKYVRITDVSVRSEFEDTADAYDLDAVSALNCGFLPLEI